MKLFPRIALVAAASAALAGCLGTDPVGPACRTFTITPVTGDTVTSETGLRYIVIEDGTGDPILRTQAATVHYIGFLQDGTLFDTTVGGSPLTFDLSGNIIRGFAEGVTGMRVSEVRRLIIPPNLAYGNDSPSPCIPANSTLLFDVELRGISGGS